MGAKPILTVPARWWGPFYLSLFKWAIRLYGYQELSRLSELITKKGEQTMSILQNLPQIVTAIGGLGTAAFGLVDATKVFWGGVNHIGFKGIENRIATIIPDKSTNALGLSDVLETLKGHWFNGTDLASQKAIAKSLIKLAFNADNAGTMAKATQVDPAVLATVAQSLANGTPLTTVQNDVYARFDLILTALLDETYQRADQAYTNGTRAWAVVFSLLLAILGASILGNVAPWGLGAEQFWEAFAVGLLATPLAPIAKDISSALSTAVNTLQLVKK
jgi:hypothetical protein